MKLLLKKFRRLDIDIERIMSFFTITAPTLGLLVSALLSSYGIFILFEDSNPILGYILAAVTIFMGIFITYSLNRIHQEIEINPHNYKLIYLMVSISIVWLFISPMFNALTFASKEAVKNEAKEQFLKIEKVANIYIEKDMLYEKMANSIRSSYEYLLEEHRIQNLPQNGGCGTVGSVCKEIERLIPQIRPTYNEFNKLYPIADEFTSEEELKKTNGKKLLDLLMYLENDIEDNALTKRDLLENYKNNKNEISKIILDITTTTSPFKKVQDILDILNNFKRTLEASVATNKYAQITLDSVSTKIKNLNDLLLQISDKDTGTLKVERPKFNNIDLNINLVLKHADKYWSLIIFAILIDVLALALIFLPILRLRKNSKRLEEIHMGVKKITLALERYNKEKATLECNKSHFDNEINRLEDLIDIEEDDNVKKINKQISEMENEMSKLVEIKKELVDTKLKKLTIESENMSNELHNPTAKTEALTKEKYEFIEAKYIIIKANICDIYDLQIEEKERAISLCNQKLKSTDTELKNLIENDPEIIIYSKELKELELEKDNRLKELKERIKVYTDELEDLKEEQIELIEDSQVQNQQEEK